MSEPLLVDARETAKLLGLSERTLWTYTDKGVIPSLKIGRSRRYSVLTLQRWIDEQQRAGMPTEADADG